MPNAHQYHYFVDGIEIKTDKASVTGAEVKASVPGLDPTYQLFLEEHGDAPDRQISDGEGVPLDPGHHGVRKFYSVPPASFGA